MSSTVISLIVTALFILVLGAGFLIGLWRGLKKSTISLICSVVGVLVAFFITPLITSTIMGVNLTLDGEIVPLREIALFYAKQDADLALLIATNEGFATLLLNVPSAVINSIMFVALTIVVEILCYLIYLVFSKFVFKTKIIEKKRRWAGAGVGLATNFIVMFIAFMPLASLIGTASYIVGAPQTTVAEAQTEETIDDSRLFSNEIPNEVKVIVSGLENNILVQMCGVFGLDNAMFDYYSSVDINGETVRIREEVVNIYDTADAIYQVQKVVNGNGSISNINFDALSNAIDKTVNGNLFKQIVSPMLGQIIVNSEDYGFMKTLSEQFPDAITHLSNGLTSEVENGGTYHDYFSADLNRVFAIVRSLAESDMLKNISSIEGKTTEEVLAYFAESENAEVIETNIEALFDVELVRAFASNLVQTLSDNLLSEENSQDVVSTLEWTDEKWAEVATSFSGIVDNYTAVSDEVDFSSEDLASTLFSTEEEIDYGVLAINLGGAVDTLRTNALLQTADGKSLVDCILAEETIDLALPTDKVIQKNEQGEEEEVAITTYTQLINHLVPTLEGIRDLEIYDTIKTATTVNEIIEAIAQKIAVEGNNDKLSEILLSAIQIDKIKTLAVDTLSPTEGDNLLDLRVLSTYDDWKKELGYLSSMLIALQNKEILQEQTALNLVLNQDYETLIDNLSDSDIDAIFKPLLWGKSTTALKSTIVSTMKTEIETMIEAGDNPITMSIDGIAFAEGEDEDQTEEFVKVVKGLVAIAKTYDADTGIKGVDKTLLGQTLDDMKENAYRTENGKTETGIFGGDNGAFVRIIQKAKQEYAVEIAGIPTLIQYGSMIGLTEEQKATYQSYYDNLNAGTYQNINFTQMLADFETITTLIEQFPI